MEAKKYNLTNRQNMQFLGMALLITVFFVGYGQWMLLQELKADYLAQMQQICEHLIQSLPPNSFEEIVFRQHGVNSPVEDQVTALNAEIQPILDNIIVPDKYIKYGVYSRQHKHNIAIGPDFDRSLLAEIDPGSFADMYETGQPELGINSNSLVWYGARAFFYRMPVQRNGLIIGHVFANVNLSKLYADAWKRTMYSLLGIAIALLLILILFQEIVIRLKRDIRLFAAKIVEGKGKEFESDLPEFTPIFKFLNEQTEKMAQLDRLNTVGEMAASIGHEVRNPMTTVRGYLQFMSTKPEFQKQQKSLLLMIDELDRANNIITDFLSLAKNHVMDFERQDLNQVITGLMPLLQADAIHRNCQLQADLDEVPEILLDTKSIRQLILNMVHNGLEAMPQGGTVKIGTRWQEDKVQLLIKDSGMGMPPEILKKLGTPFFTTKETGTGIGLSVCYRIAQRHQAEISVDSLVGSGTVFIVKFMRA